MTDPWKCPKRGLIMNIFFLNELSQANNIPDSLTMLSAFKRMFEKLRLKKNASRNRRSINGANNFYNSIVFKIYINYFFL
jgi:hypothetical protein